MFLRATSLAVVATALSISSVFAQRSLPRPVKAYNRTTVPAPPGMVYVPGGSIVMKYGQDLADSSSYKQISLSPFFIDATEVTNAQYREFVDWVADSVLITEYLKDDKYFQKGHKGDTVTARRINWGKVGSKSLWRRGDSKIQSALQPMLDHGMLRQDLLKYAFESRKPGKTQKEDKYITRVVGVYPNTMVWATDFPNSQIDVMVQDYFTNPAFNDYPVVGITWEQAQAYTTWRSNNTSRGGKSKYNLTYKMPLSLPSEAQWVYAAQGRQDLRTTLTAYGDSAIIAPRDKKNGLSANFKQDEGDYTGDGSSYTVHVMSYAPNEFGLYNMVGNVAEWTLDAYNESAWAFVHDQNPVLIYHADSNEADVMKRKVIRGGSWKDNGMQLSPYTRNYEVQDVPHSYIGFRCVMPAPEILTKQVATRKATAAKKKKVIKNNDKATASK
ncbi:MAG: gliding motility-associated lipoprotein [Sphingobacteriales bacterium]|nr:MAG: gliding motility-associated lipoprotein [Sphingobacteriales bacterium]